MGNCMNFTSAAASPKSKDRNDRERRRRMMPTPIKASSDSSVATTAACPTPVSLASTSSPTSQASSALYDISDEAGSSPITGSGSADSLDHQRKEGQQRLRDLVVTGAESGDIDWKSIIALAEDLHRKEQLLLRSASSTSSSSPAAARGGTRRMNISRKQAFFERRRKKKDLARRRKMESVGSFSVNLLYYEADEYQSMKGNSNSDKATTNASASSHDATFISNDLACDEKKNELLERSGSEDELHVFEDDNSDVSSLSSNKTLTRAAIRHPVPTSSSTNKPQFIVEGSFMAATSLFNLPKIDDDDEEECSSSSSSNSSTASETFGRSYDDDGLVTIQEDCSVSTWQQQWKQYSR